jgi:hypothetical protein
LEDSDDFVLIGIKDTPGCFSARLMGSGRIDVAMYPSLSPQEVQELRNEAKFDAVYMQVDHIPGWGLEVIERLKELM